MMTTATDLARTFNLEVKYVRLLVRRKFKRAPGRRWVWSEREADEVRRYLEEILKGSKK